jgi:hypothetical protein
VPRRKKRDTNKTIQEQASKKDEKKRSRSKEKYVNPEQLLDEYLDEVIIGLSISHLELSKEEYKEILKEPFAAAVGEVKTKPKSKTIINRLMSNKEALYEYIAIKLIMLKNIENLNESQLEFVVYNSKKILPNIINTLYNILKSKNKEDLIQYLKFIWNSYGIRSPIKCIKCEFYSIMPDLTCKVCGYTMNVKELKNQIRLMDLLIEYKDLDPIGFNEILQLGYLYYSDEGIIPPGKINKRKNGISFEIILTPSERRKLMDLSKTHNIHH